MSSKDPYATDYRAFNFTAVVIGISTCIMFVCEHFFLNDIIWRLAYCFGLFIITFAFDNSGIRTGFFRLLFQDKVFCKWLQRENKNHYVFTEALKTATYFLLSIYCFIDSGKLRIFLWILIVILNLIMFFRYAVKKEIRGESYTRPHRTVHKSLALTSAVLFFTLYKNTSVSVTMLVLFAILGLALVVFLFISNRAGKIDRFEILFMTAMVIFFCFSSVWSANYAFAFKEPQVHQVEIVNKFSKRIRMRKRYFFEIREWDNDIELYTPTQKNYSHYNEGDTFEVVEYEGALGGRWYEYKTFSDDLVEDRENGTQKD